MTGHSSNAKWRQVRLCSSAEYNTKQWQLSVSFGMIRQNKMYGQCCNNYHSTSTRQTTTVASSRDYFPEFLVTGLISTQLFPEKTQRICECSSVSSSAQIHSYFHATQLRKGLISQPHQQRNQHPPIPTPPGCRPKPHHLSPSCLRTPNTWDTKLISLGKLVRNKTKQQKTWFRKTERKVKMSDF